MNLANNGGDLHEGVPRPGKTSEEIRFAASLRYGLAILSVGVALGVGLLLQGFHFRVPATSLLLVAVAVVSWYAGRRPTVLAVILATISCYWFFVEPVRTIHITYSEIPYVIIFVGFAVLLSWFGTVRRRIEAELRASEERFRALVQFSFDVYWETNAEHRFTRQEFGEGLANAPAPGSEIGKRRWEVPYLEPDEAAWQQHRATMDAHRPFRDFELARPTPDGGKRYVSVSGLPVFEATGRFIGYRGVGRDITDRKRAEETLRRLNRELRALSNCNQILLRATDEQGLLEEICQIVCEEAGYRMAWVGYAEHDEGKSVRAVAWRGVEEGYLSTARITWADTERGRGPTGTAIRSGTSCCIQDFATDPRVALWRESALQRGFRSGIALPLKDEHANAFGSLTILSAQPNAFTSEEIRLLEELAADLAFGIVTLRSGAARKRAEAELRASEERFRTLVQFSFDVYWESDAEHRLTRQEFGEGPADMPVPRSEIGRTGWEIPYLEPDEAGWRQHQATLDAHLPFRDFEIARPARDGGKRYVSVSGLPVFDETGRFVGYRGVGRHITDRKRAEESLRQSQAYLAEAERLSHTGSWAFDVANNNYVYASEECARIFELDAQEDSRTRAAVSRLIHPEDWPRVNEAFEKSVREKVDTSSEFRITLSSGAVKHLQVIRHPVLNEAGDVVQLVGTVIDITERKRAEDALRESETRFRTFVDHAADAFFMLDFEHGTILDVNRCACESLGYTREELVGMTPLAFHLEAERAQMESVAERAAAGETAIDTHWHRRKDGSLFPVEVQTSAFQYRGRRLLLKVARDITDRVQAEAQRDRLRQLEADLAHINRVSMLGELTASIAHEVGQPLAGVVSNAGASLRWLAGDPPNLEKAREATQRIVRDGKRAGEIIARIRALTRRAATPQEKLDLNQTIQDVLALVQDEAKGKSVNIHTQFAPALAPVVGDRVQVQQLILNLVINGIDAMSSVGGRAGDLAITTRNLEPDQVQVTVDDAGIGLDPNTMDKIFDPFYTTKPGGMGMGLSISRSIIEAHGGRLWATAKDGPGTMFHFTLPKYPEEGPHA